MFSGNFSWLKQMLFFKPYFRTSHFYQRAYGSQTGLGALADAAALTLEVKWMLPLNWVPAMACRHAFDSIIHALSWSLNGRTENEVKSAAEQPRKHICPEVVSVIILDGLGNHPWFHGLTGRRASVMNGWACVLRVELLPLQSLVLAPEPQHVTSLGNRGTDDGIGWALNPTTGVLTKRRILDVDPRTGRTPPADEDRDGRDAAATQGCWKVPGSHQKPDKSIAWNAFTPQPSAGVTLLTPGFWTWTPEP